MVQPKWSGILLVCLTVQLMACDPIETGETDYHPELNNSMQPVVYGEDDRMDYYAHPNEALRTLTRQSIVALIEPRYLDQRDPDNVRINAGSLGQEHSLCSSERFRDQPTASSCSGTLIDSDLVLTAGHCVESLRDCKNFYYVFNYYYETDGSLARIGRDDIYQCSSLAVQSFSWYGSDHDYAIVKLDRPVTGGHIPARVKFADVPMDRNEPLVIVGTGSGIPFKIDDGGHVTDPRATRLDYFLGTVDAFGGNSGSGVFNENLEVVGILVRGNNDYVWRNGCYVVDVMPASGVAGDEEEAITYVARALDDYCSRNDDTHRLCGGGGGSWCSTCLGDDDCTDDWICVAHDTFPSQSYCTPPHCTSDAQCDPTHSCNAQSVCEPKLESRCDGSSVYTFNSCGLRGSLEQACSSSERCIAGDCVPLGIGNTCSMPHEVEATDATIDGSLTSDYTPNYVGSCGGEGPEKIYSFTLQQGANFTATVSGFDSIMYLRSTCEDPQSELSCNDDDTPPGNYGSRIVTYLGPGTYYLFVDSFSSDVGTYQLTLAFATSTCNEVCSPGDQVCSSGSILTCSLDSSGCPMWSQPSACPSGTTCLDNRCISDTVGDACGNPVHIEPEDTSLSGSFSGLLGHYWGSCGGSEAEMVYQFTLEERTWLAAIAFSAGQYDAILYLRSDCEDQAKEIVCNDETDEDPTGASLQIALDPGTYSLFLDSHDAPASATYQLDLSFNSLCSHECEPDTGRCIDDQAQTCTRNSQGCLVWSSLQSCPGQEVCYEGLCVPYCETHQCSSEGDVECSGDRSYMECLMDTDGCLVWSGPHNCSDGYLCVGGDGCVDARQVDSGTGSSSSSQRSSGGCQVAPLAGPNTNNENLPGAGSILFMLIAGVFLRSRRAPKK